MACFDADHLKALIAGRELDTGQRMIQREELRFKDELQIATIAQGNIDLAIE